ncbi:MAG TPA: hypothetical protein VK530_07475 [Candidatus Acidoferrum sp.]|nr:hypothetical protein [Candidatus Acidoferrum sp.]
MKINASVRSTARRAATLVEFLISMVTMVIAMGAIISTYIYGLKTTQFIKPKLGASDEARKTISLLNDEIKAAKLVRIGNGTLNSFTAVAPWARQEGSAIQIFPTVDTTSPFIRYFWDSSDKKLKRTTNGTTAAMVIANSVSNQMVFRAEDYTGTVLSNDFNNRVISMTLQFFQIQYPQMAVGPGEYYDYYQLTAKITRRVVF